MGYIWDVEDAGYARRSSPFSSCDPQSAPFSQKGALGQCVLGFHASLGARPGYCVAQQGLGSGECVGAVCARVPGVTQVCAQVTPCAGTGVSSGLAVPACTVPWHRCGAGSRGVGSVLRCKLWLLVRKTGQSHRMVCVRRDPKDHLVPIPLCVRNDLLQE